MKTTAKFGALFHDVQSLFHDGETHKKIDYWTDTKSLYGIIRNTWPNYVMPLDFNSAPFLKIYNWFVIFVWWYPIFQQKKMNCEILHSPKCDSAPKAKMPSGRIVMQDSFKRLLWNAGRWNDERKEKISIPRLNRMFLPHFR